MKEKSRCNVVLYLLNASGKPNLSSKVLHSPPCLPMSFTRTNQQQEGTAEMMSVEDIAFHRQL